MTKKKTWEKEIKMMGNSIKKNLVKKKEKEKRWKKKKEESNNIDKMKSQIETLQRLHG